MERKHLYTVLALGGLALATGGAFSRPVRQQILERDGARCVLCGATDHLEAAHIDHNKMKPRYNDVSNGRMLCVEDHLKDHVNRDGRNGLTREQNQWSINILKKKAGVVYESE